MSDYLGGFPKKLARWFRMETKIGYERSEISRPVQHPGPGAFEDFLTVSQPIHLIYKNVGELNPKVGYAPVLLGPHPYFIGNDVKISDSPQSIHKIKIFHNLQGFVIPSEFFKSMGKQKKTLVAPTRPIDLKSGHVPIEPGQPRTIDKSQFETPPQISLKQAAINIFYKSHRRGRFRIKKIQNIPGGFFGSIIHLSRSSVGITKDPDRKFLRDGYRGILTPSIHHDYLSSPAIMNQMGQAFTDAVLMVENRNNDANEGVVLHFL